MPVGVPERKQERESNHAVRGGSVNRAGHLNRKKDRTGPIEFRELSIFSTVFERTRSSYRISYRSSYRRMRISYTCVAIECSFRTLRTKSGLSNVNIKMKIGGIRLCTWGSYQSKLGVCICRNPAFSDIQATRTLDGLFLLERRIRPASFSLLSKQQACLACPG